MKKLLLSAVILAVSGTAFAADNGFYAGAQAGWANTGDTVSLGSGSNDTNNVFSGGAFAGYQISPNFAAQLGYTKLANSTSEYGPAELTLKTQIVDLVGKVMYPIQNTGISIYGKAGAAYVDDTADLSFDSVNYGSGSTHPIRPEVGAGLSYDINSNLSANVDYSFIAKNDSIDNINSVMVGLAYHFA